MRTGSLCNFIFRKVRRRSGRESWIPLNPAPKIPQPAVNRWQPRVTRSLRDRLLCCCEESSAGVLQAAPRTVGATKTKLQRAAHFAGDLTHTNFYDNAFFA